MNDVFAIKTELLVREARKNLFAFMRYMLPDEEDPENPDKSEYSETRHGRMLCEIVHRFYAKDMMRTALSVPPQSGKTWHLSTYGLAWILGKNPRAKVIVATYNEVRAAELGEDFRKVIISERFQRVFPNTTLEVGSQSKTLMSTTRGGRVVFVGVGGTITGRGAHYFIIDDPIKGDDDAQSAVFRDKLWSWFFSVAYSRGSKKTPILVIHTRWHQDDLIGRLCDPDHPNRRKKDTDTARDWKYVNIPGVITDARLAGALGLTLSVPTEPSVIQAFGAQPMSALWPENKDLAHYAQWRLAEPRTFSALVMGQPNADDGDYFRAEWLHEYEQAEMPPLSTMEIYGASDHAVGVKQNNDYTVLGCVGVDQNHDIWVLPDLVWSRMETDRTVNEIIWCMQRNQPRLWWMESELISKAFGPFLRKRMQEENAYFVVDPVVPSGDKQKRASAIQGRVAMGKVRFPKFAHWWPEARSQLLKFPNGVHDDFVDWMAHIGHGLAKQIAPSTELSKTGKVVFPSGSIQWILNRTRLEVESGEPKRVRAGW